MNVSKFQTDNQCLTKALSRTKQFSYDAIQEQIQALDLKAIMASGAISKTIEDLSAWAVPSTLDQVGLDGLLRWIA